MNTAPLSPSSPTIRDRQERLERALESLRCTSAATSLQDSTSILSELRMLLAPPTLRATVQLEEDGRKKRSTAAESNWRFDSGEIVIFYEPPSARLELVEDTPFITSDSPAVDDESIRQCCEVLAEAEKAGKQFVGYKWFRDLALAAVRHPWSATPEGRARVLKEAIDRGAIETRKIPNPKAPMHPTTTVRLVPRGLSPITVKSRFNPVPIHGEPTSVTLLRDRGKY